jgi:hypothetical protein
MPRTEILANTKDKFNIYLEICSISLKFFRKPIYSNLYGLSIAFYRNISGFMRVIKKERKYYNEINDSTNLNPLPGFYNFNV